MKLIFIYGPPASGKLTVAKELSKITGYKVFHNHTTLDILEPIFGYEHKRFWDINREIRNKLLDFIAREKIDAIMTYCFIKGEDEKKVKKFINIVKKHKGKIYFVNLNCSKKEIFKRVKNPSRKRMTKISSIKSLETKLKKGDFFSPVPFKPNLILDNSNISAKKVALNIKKHYKL